MLCRSFCPRTPHHSAFLCAPLRILLWLTLALSPRCILGRSGDGQGDESTPSCSDSHIFGSTFVSFLDLFFPRLA